MSLLCLVMILKDEAHTISKTLLSVMPAIDRYSILDTGSTDGTQDLIRDVMKGVSGVVHEGEFTNFAETRNRSLDLAGLDSTFILNLDADDVLVGAKRLREFLTGVKNLKDEGYNLEIRTQSQSWSTARLFRASARWRYVGAVHELLLPPGADSYPADMRRITGVAIEHVIEGESVGTERTKKRWTRDLKLLTEELERNPKNSRAAFYRGRTLQDLATLGEDVVALNLQAFKAYEVRAKMEGFREEVFLSYLYGARCARVAGLPFAQCVSLWHRAIDHSPGRIEPYADLVAEHSKLDEHGLVVLYARRALDFLGTVDRGGLFVEDYDYFINHHLGWHAWYTGAQDHAVGKAAAKRACDLPQAAEADRANLRNYQSRERESRK